MSGNGPMSKMFCLIRSVSSGLPLQVALGEATVTSTRTLNQCSYMTYDNLSKSDSAESLLFLLSMAGQGTQQTLPGPGNELEGF